ncbi:MAG: hypothetical protein J5483_06145 [Lachnospiraceae bacterium]|nr:hypothetical protein [Lachnospiraceae bacterium]
MNNTQAGTERTIRVYDLFLALCQRWRSLIICFVIGAIVLGGYGWWKSGGSDALTDETVESFVEKFDSGRKEVLEGYASEYTDSIEQIEKQSDYNKNSALMQLDPFHLSVYEVKYYLSTGEEDTYVNTAALAQAYISQLQTEYLGQKVTAVFEGDNGAIQKELYESPNLIQIDTKDIASGILTFRIYAQDVLPEADTAALKNQVQTAQGRVRKAVGDHSLTMIGESSFVTADMDIMKIQGENVKRVDDLTYRIESIRKAVTDSSEKQYLNFLIEKKLNLEAASEPVSQSRHIRKKFILVGALLGLILAAIVIVIKYIATNSVKTGREMEENFGLQILGWFDGKDSFYKKRKTKLDKWLRSLRNKKADQVPYEEMVDLVATKIRIEAEKRETHQVCMILDGNVSGDTDFIEAVRQKIGEEPKLTVISNILQQSGELAGLSDKDGAVLIGQIGKSRFDDIRSICALCENYHVNVIGSIILD